MLHGDVGPPEGCQSFQLVQLSCVVPKMETHLSSTQCEYPHHTHLGDAKWILETARLQTTECAHW
ncbi:hypothetical protein D3C74_415270 [compost metagenome]